MKEYDHPETADMKPTEREYLFCKYHHVMRIFTLSDVQIQQIPMFINSLQIANCVTKL